MRPLHQTLTLIFAFCLVSSAALADTPATAPATTTGAMKVYITEVTGLVQVRDSDTQPWRKAVVHGVVTEGAEFRTGPHSSVTCVIPPDQTFTLDRLGTVRVEEAAQHGNKITTDLIMKYGRTRYDIEAAGLEHEASIISPSSTLAVRGTTVSLFDQPPFKPEAISYTGRASFRYHRSTVPVGTKKGTLVRALAGTDGASETGVDDSVVDPKFADARTAADTALISSEVARGAVLSYDPISRIPVITGGRPDYNSELPNHLPGALDFVLRWTGNADLNIEVGVDKGDPLTAIAAGFQASEFLYPGFGLQNSASGGHIAFDDRGGPKGGEEIAYWPSNYPAGLYGIAAQNMSGVATSFTFNVYANGVPLNMFYFNFSGSTPVLVKSTQVTHELDPFQNDTAIIPIPPIDALNKVPNDPAPNPGITAGSFSIVSTAKLRKSTPLDVPSRSIMGPQNPSHR